MITPTHYLLLSALLFLVGIVVVTTRKNSLVLLLGTGLMLQAAGLSLAALTSWFQDWNGQVAILTIAIISVVQLTIGLGAILTLNRRESLARK